MTLLKCFFHPETNLYHYFADYICLFKVRSVFSLQELTHGAQEKLCVKKVLLLRIKALLQFKRTIEVNDNFKENNIEHNMGINMGKWGNNGEIIGDIEHSCKIILYFRKIC